MSPTESARRIARLMSERISRGARYERRRVNTPRVWAHGQSFGRAVNGERLRRAPSALSMSPTESARRIARLESERISRGARSSGDAGTRRACGRTAGVLAAPCAQRLRRAPSALSMSPTESARRIARLENERISRGARYERRRVNTPRVWAHRRSFGRAADREKSGGAPSALSMSPTESARRIARLENERISRRALHCRVVHLILCPTRCFSSSYSPAKRGAHCGANEAFSERKSQQARR